MIDAPPCQTVNAKDEVKVPLLRSSFSDKYHGQHVQMKWELWYDNLGTRVVAQSEHMSVNWDGYGVADLPPLFIIMPDQDAVAVLAVSLINNKGEVITRNFITFDVRSGNQGERFEGDGDCISIPVGAYKEHNFNQQWEAIQCAKINGAGQGRYAYDVTLPDGMEKKMIGEIEIMFEASAKQYWLEMLKAQSKMKWDLISCMVQMLGWSIIRIRII